MPYKHNDSRRHTQRAQVNSLNPSIRALMLVPIMKFYANAETLLSGFLMKHLHPGSQNVCKVDEDDQWNTSIERYAGCLMIRQVYTLPLRQTQGFIRSLIKVMGLNISFPDFNSISKRSTSLILKRLVDSITPGTHIIVDSTGIKVYGKDEWHQEKHKVNARRTWRKLLLGIDEAFKTALVI